MRFSSDLQSGGRRLASVPIIVRARLILPTSSRYPTLLDFCLALACVLRSVSSFLTATHIQIKVQVTFEILQAQLDFASEGNCVLCFTHSRHCPRVSVAPYFSSSLCQRDRDFQQGQGSLSSFCSCDHGNVPGCYSLIVGNQKSDRIGLSPETVICPVFGSIGFFCIFSVSSVTLKMRTCPPLVAMPQ
jgi:hypothetical protein